MVCQMRCRCHPGVGMFRWADGRLALTFEARGPRAVQGEGYLWRASGSDALGAWNCSGVGMFRWAGG